MQYFFRLSQFSSQLLFICENGIWDTARKTKYIKLTVKQTRQEAEKEPILVFEAAATKVCYVCSNAVMRKIPMRSHQLKLFYCNGPNITTIDVIFNRFTCPKLAFFTGS